MNTTTPSISPDVIAARAYRLWDDAERPQARDEEFWFRAEQELTAGAEPLDSTTHSGKTAPSRKSLNKR